MYQTHFLIILERKKTFKEDKKYLENFFEESAEFFTKELPEMKLRKEIAQVKLIIEI